MTCRHRAGDPDCSSSAEGKRRLEEEYAESRRQEKLNRETLERTRLAKIAEEEYAMTPDSSNYEVIEAEQVGKNLVLKVRYPNCTKCSYEGNKILVFLGISPMQALRWKKIDPHFREPNKADSLSTEAPGPSARFPASQEGWNDAIAYAEDKL